MSFKTEAIRNIAIAGHGGTGKTTLVEQILFNGGVIGKAEAVESGKTVSDYTPEEIERGMSIHSSFSHLEWNNHTINILDTPGASDFVGEVVAAFRSAESAVMLVDAQAGVQIETIKLWRRLNQREMPRIVFVNKCDKERADYDNALADLRDKFQKTLVPVTIPIGTGASFKGIVNLIENKAYMVHDPSKKDEASDIPADMADTVEEARMVMMEAAAEGDDELLDKYFEEGTLTPDEIRKGLMEGLRDNKIVPVLCGSALQNNGIASFLNFLDYAAPSPAVMHEYVEKDGEEEEFPVNADGPAAAFVFKTSIDQFNGKLSYVKVVSGTIKSDADLVMTQEGKKVRIGKVYKSTGKKLDEVDGLQAGDIGIVNKIDALSTNASICEASSQVTFHQLRLPQPVYSLAISAANKKEEDKLNEMLHRISTEDLTFTVAFNEETKENVISGMGELHINMILDKVRDKAKVEPVTKVPRVAYRETITKSADAEYSHKKQTGGHGQFGRVIMNISPLQRGEMYSFTNAIKGGSISKGYMPGIEKGFQEGMTEGYLAGYPLVDIGFTVVDGKEHPVDSSEMAFKLAAKGALKAAVEKAGPVLLEPVMKLAVFAEEQYVGDILSDMSSRRGRVLGQETLGGGIAEIDAEVPQSEMLRYSIDLRSITSGTASFELEFSHYNPISGKLAEQVIAASKAEE